jgi:hypothetical protein
MKHGFLMNESVYWTNDDDDIPKGAVGRVIGFTEERVRVQFPNDWWDLKPEELGKASCLWANPMNGPYQFKPQETQEEKPGDKPSKSEEKPGDAKGDKKEEKPGDKKDGKKEEKPGDKAGDKKDSEQQDKPGEKKDSEEKPSKQGKEGEPPDGETGPTIKEKKGEKRAKSGSCLQC